jgi:diguanylate cyclase (GGDEF)-like protein
LQLALLFLDIDYFKVINDTLGDDNGDKLLVHVANTLSSILCESDIAARKPSLTIVTVII